MGGLQQLLLFAGPSAGNRCGFLDFQFMDIGQELV